MVEAISSGRFERLVLPHIDAAYAFALWLTADEAAAADLAQDACLRAYRHVDTLRGDNAKPWLLRIVRNCFYTQVKASGARGQPVSFELVEAEVEQMLQTASPVVDQEETLVRLEEQELVDRALADLPTDCRAVLLLREIEELSYKEIAEALGIPIGTVMSRLARARQRLSAAVQILRKTEAGT